MQNPFASKNICHHIFVVFLWLHYSSIYSLGRNLYVCMCILCMRLYLFLCCTSEIFWNKYMFSKILLKFLLKTLPVSLLVWTHLYYIHILVILTKKQTNKKVSILPNLLPYMKIIIFIQSSFEQQPCGTWQHTQLAAWTVFPFCNL